MSKNKIDVHVTLSLELKDLAEKNNIKLSHALVHGIQSLLNKTKINDDIINLQLKNQKLETALQHYITLTKDLQEKILDFELKIINKSP